MNKNLQMIFVNLPVTNLPRSKAFYEAVGFTTNSQFSDGIPRNAMHGPAYVELDMNLGHDFPLTRKGDKGPMLSLTVNSFNVLNHPNYLTYIGVVGSPFFGKPVAAQPPRRMQLNLEFKF